MSSAFDYKKKRVHNYIIKKLLKSVPVVDLGKIKNPSKEVGYYV